MQTGDGHTTFTRKLCVASSSPGVLKNGEVSKGAIGVCSNPVPEIGAQEEPC